MRPTIKTGYPVVIQDTAGPKTGIACDTTDYERTGRLELVYVDHAFTVRKTTVVWRGADFGWLDPDSRGVVVENDPALEPFVTTVKNGRY
ncbi:MAG: hypothetical protein EOL86_06630 [Deltaproteobacteria bacterium]|nr:hypothetical protein [Deltaproteobacteria bacterium]